MDRPRRAGLRAKTIPHSTQPTGVFRGLANMHHSSFAKQWHSLSAGKPGHRFRDRYYSNKKNSEQRWAGRIVRFALAAVILVGAAVLTVIPGPAIPLFLVAGALIASDWLWMAKIMDRIEVGLRKDCQAGRQVLAESAHLRSRAAGAPHDDALGHRFDRNVSLDALSARSRHIHWLAPTSSPPAAGARKSSALIASFAKKIAPITQNIFAEWLLPRLPTKSVV